MSDAQPIQFEHVVIDADGPLDPHVKTAGDVDGDGYPDIVVASSKNGPLVWYQWPDWRRHVIAPSSRWSCAAVLTDMDGDGDADLLISEWYSHNRMEWYENPLPDGDPAAGPWKRHIIGEPRAHDIRVADLDADGQVEIVTRDQGDAGNRILVWKRTGADAWTHRAIPCPTGEGLAVADLAGDGHPAIVIGGRWYEAPDDIMGDPWTEHTFADWPPDCAIQVVDMNGNGRLDVVLARSEGKHRLSWFESPADPRTGGWDEHVVDDSVDYAHSLIVCDMNGDGRLDIVTAEMHQSERKRVMVYLNERDAVQWRRLVLATTGSHNMCIADLGNTGRPDVIGANWSGDYQPVETWQQRPDDSQ
jgi:hypothetical protein